MSVYSKKQHVYIDVFMSQVNALFNHSLDSTKDETSFLEALSQTTDALSAGITLTSLAIAVPTLGASVGAGAACIVLLKTGVAVYRYVRSHSEANESIENLTEMTKAERRLSLLVLFRQTAFLLASRYAHVINDVIDEKDIGSFAEFAFARVMKKLTIELKKSQKTSHTTSPPQDLVFPNHVILADYLLSSINLSAIYDTKKVNLKKSNHRFSFLKQSTAHTKLLYARPRWVIYDENGACHIYASDHENLIKPDSTLPEYGFISLPNTYLSYDNIAVNTTRLKALNHHEIDNQSDLLEKMNIEHQVTREEVEHYLTYIRTHKNQKSLNDYLFEIYKIQIIASCHDDRLSGLDLSDGIFSEVNFHHAQLKHCNLSNTSWKGAHLEWCQFERNTLTNVLFCDASLEYSGWLNVLLEGNFSNARMNGSFLTDCDMSLNLIQQDCDWELCTRERVTVNGEQVTFNRHIEAQLSLELQARIKQGDDFNQRLDNISEHVTELQVTQHKQELQLSEQQDAVLSIQERLHTLEYENDVIHIIKRHWETWFNTPAYQEAKKSYVELDVSTITDGEEVIVPFGDKSEHFMQSDTPFLLIHGGATAGKSLFAQLLQEDLLRRYQNPDTDWLPIYINLYELPFSEENFLLTALGKLFSETQLYALAAYRCVIIIDGLEDSAFPLLQRNLFIECATLGRIWKSCDLKVIALAQTRFLRELEVDFHQLLSPSPEAKLSVAAVCEILPPNRKQARQLLHSFHIDEASMQCLDSIKHILITPFMFKIIAMILPTLPVDKTLPTSKVKLYDVFCTNWFNHVKHKLSREETSENSLQFHIQDLSFEMFKKEAYWIERPYQRERQNRQKAIADPLSYLFANKTNRVSPLIMTMHTNDQNQMVMRYEFIHRSFRDYGIAQKLLNDFLGIDANLDKFLINWNYRLLTEIPDVLFFLQGIIEDHQESETILRHLLDMVLASRNTLYTPYLYSCANAMTLMCRLGFDFSGLDLSYIRIPKAELIGGLFAFTNLTHCDLTETCFQDSMLLCCDMSGSILTGVKYINAPSVLQAKIPPQTFAVSPNTSEITIAYDIPPTVSGALHQIAIARLSDGKIYHCWPAHGQTIHGMAWTTHAGTPRLASAGAGGTVRVWAMKKNSDTYEEIAKLNHFKHKYPIISLSWFKDGNSLAISSKDRIIRIWDVNEKNRVFKSEVHQSEVITIVCGHLSPMLISACDEGLIRVWNNPREQPSVLKKIDLTDVLTEHRAGKIASMALSCDESQLALGCSNGEIIIINLNENDLCPIAWSGHKDSVTSLIWPNHTLMSASQDKTIRIWSTKDDPTIFQHDDYINKIELSPDGHQLLSGGGSQSTHICAWNTTKTHMSQDHTDLLGNVSCLIAHNPPNEALSHIAAGFVNGSVIVWSIHSIHPFKATVVSHLELSKTPISHMALSNDGRYLASMGYDSVIFIQDILHQNPTVAIIRANENTWFNDIRWGTTQAHRYHLAVGSSDGSIYFYDCPQYIDDAHQLTNKSDEKKYVVIHQSDMAIQEHPLHSESEQGLQKNEKSIQCFTIAPNLFDTDRTWLVSSSEKQFSIWRYQDRDENQLIHQFSPSTGGATKLEWSLNGYYFVSSNKKGSIYVWDAKKYVCLLEHTAFLPIKSLIWHSEFLVSSTEKTMHVWHLPFSPNLSAPPKIIPIGANFLTMNGKNIGIAKEKGIYLLNFKQLIEQPLSISSWVGLIKKDLILDQHTLLDVVGLSREAVYYMALKGAIITPEMVIKNPFNQLFALIFPTKSAVKTSNQTPLLSQLGVFSSASPNKESTEGLKAMTSKFWK